MLRSGAFKCFGDNRWGQLAAGDTVARGNSSDTIGTSLPAVNAPTGGFFRTGGHPNDPNGLNVTVFNTKVVRPPAPIKSDLCATFSAGVIPSTSFNVCPVSGDAISTCGAPFIVSPVAATLHVVTDDLGHVDDLACVDIGCGGNITSHVDLTYDDAVVNHNGARLTSKQAATHREALRCASLRITNSAGKHSPSAAGAWSHSECTVSVITAGSVYRCTCTRVDIAVALSLPGGYVSSEWNSGGVQNTCYDGVQNGAET
jgi:hypothetical protein